MVMDSSHDTEELKIFKQTSNEPYLRHHYKVVYNDGTHQTFDNYEDVQVLWWNRTGNFLSHVEVLDIKQKSRGFV
jgi:hypothetical protein